MREATGGGARAKAGNWRSLEDGQNTHFLHSNQRLKWGTLENWVLNRLNGLVRIVGNKSPIPLRLSLPCAVHGVLPAAPVPPHVHGIPRPALAAPRPRQYLRPREGHCRRRGRSVAFEAADALDPEVMHGGGISAPRREQQLYHFRNRVWYTQPTEKGLNDAYL